MATSITKDKKKIAFTSEATLKFADGVTAVVPSTVTGAVALAAYNKAVVPPPVIIIPPSPGQPKEITLSDLATLSDVENQNFTVKTGISDKGFSFKNMKNVAISGLGKCQFVSNYRVGSFGSGISNLKLSGFDFNGIPDYAMTNDLRNIAYVPGDNKTYIDGLILDAITATNCATLFQGDGDIINGKYTGVIKGFELSNSILKGFKNPGSVIYLGNGLDYKIYSNYLNDINMLFSKDAPNGIHNGIFFLKGNGLFHDNNVTNHQGNVGRFWLHSIEGLKTVEAYNNFVYNSWKYSAFELQNIQSMIENGAKVANANIYNNIAGRLSVSKDWDGQMLDLYNYNGGLLQYFGNYGFDFTGTKPVTNMINNMSDTKIVTEKDNVYYPTLDEALSVIPTLKTLLSA